VSVGYVYVLTNPSMPGLVKVGKTTRDPEQRALELWQTGVPQPFVVHHYSRVPDCHAAETAVHLGIEDLRVHGSREFYRADADHAAEIVKDVAREQIYEFVNEFDESLTVVEEHCFIDPSYFNLTADRIGVSGYLVSEALDRLLHEGQLDDILRATVHGRLKSHLRVLPS
jgi:hypothetical protein